MGAMASQITSHTSVYSSVYSGADQRKHQSSASLAFVPARTKGQQRKKKFPFDDFIMMCTEDNQNIESAKSIKGNRFEI